MLEVAIRPRAQLDLESIYLHIALACGAPHAAEDTIEEIYRAIERVRELPDLGKLFESERLARPYRRTLTKSYWVYYSIEGEKLVVWRIFHTRQDVEDSTLIEF